MPDSRAPLAPSPQSAHDLATLPLTEAAWEYAQASRSSATRRAYRSDFRDFECWCERFGQTHLPARPQTLALYLTTLAGTLKAGTIARRLVAIRAVHRAANCDDPTGNARVRAVLAGIKRTFGTEQVGKAAIRLDELRCMTSDSIPVGMPAPREYTFATQTAWDGPFMGRNQVGPQFVES